MRSKITLATSSMVIPGQRNQFSPQRLKLPVQGWIAEMQFDLKPSETQMFQGFLAGLDGPVGSTTFPDWDYDYKGKRGTATGTITATGSKDAETVALSGITGTLLAGDRLGIAGWVYIVTADVTASGSAASPSIRPPLRAACTAAAVILTGLKFTMSGVGDLANALEFDPVGRATGTLQFAEDLSSLA